MENDGMMGFAEIDMAMDGLTKSLGKNGIDPVLNLRELRAFSSLLEGSLQTEYDVVTEHWGAHMTPQSFQTLVRWQGL